MVTHPLDKTDEEDDLAHGEMPAGNSGPSRSILRGSLICLAVTGLVVLLSAVAANSASPNSTTESMASIVNKVSTILLLFAFLGILVAYQLPNFQRGMATVLESNKPLHAPLSSQSRLPPVIQSPTRKRDPEYTLLLVANFGLLLGGWLIVGFVYALGGLNFITWIMWPFLFLIPSLLVTMIVWHRRLTRAFAIGALPALVGVYFAATTFPMLVYNSSFGGGSRVGYQATYLIGLGIGLTGVVLSGLLCATYVKLLLHFRSSNSSAHPHQEEK